MQNWTKLHAIFLSDLISSLNNSGIRYFLLRNYEGLPEENIGKDVDIVIEPGSYRIVKNLLTQQMKTHQIHYYTTSRFDRMVCWYVVDLDKDFSIHIDIMENESYKGYTFFAFDELYNNTTTYKNMRVLKQDYDIVLLLAQNIVAYKNLKEKYRTKISQLYPKYRSQFIKLSNSLFGAKCGGRLINYLDINNFDEIVEQSRDFERSFKKQQMKRKPLKSFVNVVHFVADRFYRVIWCPYNYQRLIAIEAPDGTGKSTFVDNLTKRLAFFYNSDENRFAVHHFRPNILPNMGAAGEMMHVAKQDTDFTNPHRAKPSGFVMSMIRMTYYWLDYIIGVPILLRKEVHYEKYSFYDRYIYDFLVDPYRTRVKLPYWIRSSFTKIVKQPQIIFVLNAAPDIIYDRKQELTLEEIKRQLILFENIRKSFDTAVEIDANKTPSEMVNNALKIIFSRFFNYVE